MESSPSKKVIIVLVLVAILVSVIIFSSNFINNSGSKNLSQDQINKVDLIVKNTLAKGDVDSDGDTLPDWQESLWGTDPQNPDTDGDGTDDFAEIQENRNPLKPGPDDKKLSDSEYFEKYIAEPAGITTNPDSLTGILSKELLLNYAYAKQQAGGDLSEDEQGLLVEQLAEQTISQINLPEKYPDYIFLTFDSTDQEKLKEYGLELGYIQLEEFSQLQENNEDLKILSKIYEDLATRYAGLPVPKELLTIHKNITNNFYYVSEVLTNINNYQQDPLLSLLSIPIYRKIADEQPVLFEQINIFLENNDIIFNENEEQTF